MVMVMVVSDPLRFSILSKKQVAHFPSYLRLNWLTVRTEDYLVEETRLLILLRQLVSDGAHLQAPGTSHTLSGRGDNIMCPGPLPQECISLEVGTIWDRQRRWSWMDQLRRVLVWNMTLSRLQSLFHQQLCYSHSSLSVWHALFPTMTIRRLSLLEDGGPWRQSLFTASWAGKEIWHH